MSDRVDKPAHYRHLPVECIDIAENFNYNLGNALKYIWRCDYKGEAITDLKKARWYLDREIKRREKEYIDSLNTGWTTSIGAKYE
jgi:hypothetical protein